MFGWFIDFLIYQSQGPNKWVLHVCMDFGMRGGELITINGGLWDQFFRARYIVCVNQKASIVVSAKPNRD